jgi:glycosyltransferase involved in cell wall biosynthesis
MKKLEFRDEDYYRHIVDETDSRLVPWVEENTVSLCMMVKNEEEHLEKCLKSAERFVDEIIIVDTGSTDKTKEIALKFTDKVYDYPWSDDFSDPRNFALEKATGHWVLQLDADEYVPVSTFKHIFEKTQFTDVDAYLCPIKNWQDDPERPGEAPWVLSETFRLFKNSPDIYYKGYVHEDIYQSLSEASKNRPVRMNRLNSFIWHFGYLRPEKPRKEKYEYYAKLSLRQIEENPQDSRAVLNYAIHLYHTGNLDEAEKWYEKAIEIKPDLWPAYNDLGVIKLKKAVDPALLAQSQRYFQSALRFIKNEPMAGVSHKGRIIKNLTEINKLRTSVNNGDASNSSRNSSN